MLTKTAMTMTFTIRPACNIDLAIDPAYHAHQRLMCVVVARYPELSVALDDYVLIQASDTSPAMTSLKP